MKTLLTVLTATVALAAVSPAFAQPLEIIVRGGTPSPLPTFLPDGDEYVYGWPENPNNPNFDPAAMAINAWMVTHPRLRTLPVNISLASRLAYSTGSWADHQIRCQARYATYDPISDTHIDNGLPERCY